MSPLCGFHQFIAVLQRGFHILLRQEGIFLDDLFIRTAGLVKPPDRRDGHARSRHHPGIVRHVPVTFDPADLAGRPLFEAGRALPHVLDYALEGYVIDILPARRPTRLPRQLVVEADLFLHDIQDDLGPGSVRMFAQRLRGLLGSGPV